MMSKSRKLYNEIVQNFKGKFEIKIEDYIVRVGGTTLGIIKNGEYLSIVPRFNEGRCSTPNDIFNIIKDKVEDVECKDLDSFDKRLEHTRKLNINRYEIIYRNTLEEYCNDLNIFKRNLTGYIPSIKSILTDERKAFLGELDLSEININKESINTGEDYLIMQSSDGSLFKFEVKDSMTMRPQRSKNKSLPFGQVAYIKLDNNGVNWRYCPVWVEDIGITIIISSIEDNKINGKYYSACWVDLKSIDCTNDRFQCTKAKIVNGIAVDTVVDYKNN